MSIRIVSQARGNRGIENENIRLDPYEVKRTYRSISLGGERNATESIGVAK